MAEKPSLEDTLKRSFQAVVFNEDSELSKDTLASLRRWLEKKGIDLDLRELKSAEVAPSNGAGACDLLMSSDPKALSELSGGLPPEKAPITLLLGEEVQKSAHLQFSELLSPELLTSDTYDRTKHAHALVNCNSFPENLALDDFWQDLLDFRVKKILLAEPGKAALI